MKYFMTNNNKKFIYLWIIASMEILLNGIIGKKYLQLNGQ